MNEPLAPAPRRLYRSPDDRKLTGVCGGLAEYFGIDPVVVRVVTVLLVLATGVTAVAYVLAAIIIPLRPEDVPREDPPPSLLQGGDARATGLILLVCVAAVVAIADGDWLWWFNGPAVGLTLLGIGLWMLFFNDDEKGIHFATRSVGRTTLVGEAASERDQIDGESTTTDPSPRSDDSAGPRGEVPPPVPPWGPSSPVTAGFEPPPPSPERTWTAAGSLALLLIGAGIVATLTVFDIWGLNGTETFGAVIAVMGAILMVGAWYGRPRVLIAFGLPLLGLLLLIDAIGLPTSGGAGERRVEVSTMGELRTLEDEHELFAGELILDLSEAPLGRPGAPTPEIEADVGMGQLTVYLPAEVTAEIEADVSAGEINIDGRTDDGLEIERSDQVEGEEGGGRIKLDLHVGLGEVRVFHG